MNFFEFLASADPTESALRDFLRTRTEWIGLEFKEARRTPAFGLRKAVAALGNTAGGDIFLGVDNSRNLIGTAVDPVEISRVLRQEGAPSREGCLTNLLQAVRDPRPIPLATGLPAYWLDVAAQGLVVAAFDQDKDTLRLFDRPGAESEELKGFAAIDLFQRKTRARLLVALYVEARHTESRFTWVYQGPNFVREDWLTRLRAILESPEWRFFATHDDRALENDAYLGKFLSLADDYRSWSGQPYRECEQELILRKNDLGAALGRLRTYLETNRIALPG